MFGELKIITSSVEVDETAFASPSVVRLIVYLLLHNKRSYTSREIADVFWRDDIEIDPAKAAGNLRTQVSRTRKEMKTFCWLPQAVII